MRRNPWKWAVLGGAIAIILIYGIELSTTGIERINGPLTSPQQNVQAPQDTAMALEDRAVSDFDRVQQQKIAQLEKELEELKRMTKLASEAASLQTQGNERLPGLPYEANQPAVNRMADSTSGLLQSMSSEGIRLVVSIFDGLTK